MIVKRNASTLSFEHQLQEASVIKNEGPELPMPDDWGI